MRPWPNPSRRFTGLGPILVPDWTLNLDVIMLDLVFVILGAALFLGALIYARACANV